MNANPHTCQHLNLVYEKVAGADPFIRCDDCYTTWDADQPITDAHTCVTLNPDNEPTSKHMQWSEDKCSDQS